jgi:hypothetical protein
MIPCKTPRSCRWPSLFALLAALCVISLSCNTLSGLVPTPGGEATEQGTVQGEAPPEAVEAPAVLGFVLDPDGVPVAYASIGDEYTDRNGGVSGDLVGSASGWLEVKELGSATGYAKPGALIGETAFFEARLTPFEVFLPLESEEEVVFTLGDAAQPVAEVSIPAGAVSTLPAFVEAATYDLVDVGPRQAGLSSGEAMDLGLAFAVEARSESGDSVPLAAGQSITVTVFPSLALPASPTLAVFDVQAGTWQVHEGACTPAEAGGVLCAVPQFAPLVGLFGPQVDPTAAALHDAEAFASIGPAGGGLFRRTPAGNDQDFQAAEAAVEIWIGVGQGQLERTGELSAEWEAEMTIRAQTLADAAAAYADAHPDTSGISHLLLAAQLALLTGRDPAIADKLMKQAREVAAAAAEALLEEGDCGRIHEMLLAAQQLMLLGGSQAIIDALMEKVKGLFDCDIWSGTIHVWLNVSSSPPGGLDYALESGGGTWMETHKVTMTTNVQTHVLKGEDSIKLDFGEVMYGKKDRHGCHDYLTHSGEGESIYLNFDGQYDGYAFTVGDLKPVGGSSSILYGAHGEHWVDVDEKCEVISDQTVPAPNYSSVLVHGFSGTPPITMQAMLQGGDNTNIGGRQPITNDAYELGIIPVETGHVIWSFYHAKKVLPLK